MNDPIVISGFSCRLPESDNAAEFEKNLLTNVDMITPGTRWPDEINDKYDLPRRCGKTKNPKNFDAAFFSVTPLQANYMDPTMRMLQEAAFEAVIDAGIHPSELRGTRTAVIIGVANSETWSHLGEDMDNVSGYILPGTTRSMFANRISYFYDLRGPSFAVDTACSSSLLALKTVFDFIESSSCDAAIIAGAAMHAIPQSWVPFRKLSIMSPEGACKTFDAAANGYVKSEGVVACVVQRASAARRQYMQIAGISCLTDGYKPEGVGFPAQRAQCRLLEAAYKMGNIDPKEISYFEAHGTGTKVGDVEEMNGAHQVICGHKSRENPLLIGSVKSNCGHTEGNSGLTSMLKVAISMKNKTLTANLNYNNPNPNIKGLVDKTMKVVDENVPWDGKVAAINNFGFGGCNVHCVAKGPLEPQMDYTFPNQSVLFTYGGRTEQACRNALEYVGNEKDYGAFQLMGNTASISTLLWPWRGYTIINDGSEKPKITTKRITEKYSNIGFIFCGMGSKTKPLPESMLDIVPFKAIIDRLVKIADGVNMNLYDLLFVTGPDRDDPKSVFVFTACTQLALTNTLRQIGVEPEYLIGHSFGEICCAYADGAITLEEAFLCAYYRGQSLEDEPIVPGRMVVLKDASVPTVSALCSKFGVDIASINTHGIITVAGSNDKMGDFVEAMEAKNMKIREVQCSGIPFHSRHILPAGKVYERYLTKVFEGTTQRKVTKKWISTSKEDNELQGSTVNPVKYFTNNLVVVVRLQKALDSLPKNTLLIEISPSPVLLQMLKHGATDISVNCLFDNQMEQPKMDMMNNLGWLFALGVDMNTTHLLPSAEFPVPSKTAMVGSLVGWSHKDQWHVIEYGKHTVDNTKNRNMSTINESGGANVVNLLKEIIGAGEDTVLDPMAEIHELGMDSLLTAQFSERLKQLFGFNISVAELRTTKISSLVEQLGDCKPILEGKFDEDIGMGLGPNGQVVETTDVFCS